MWWVLKGGLCPPLNPPLETSMVDRVNPHIVEVSREAGTTHRHQADARAVAQVVRPHPAAHPVLAVVAGIGGVEFLAAMGPLHNPQVGPFSGRTDHGVAVARVAGWLRAQLFG